MTKALVRHARLKLGHLEIKNFSDGELYVRPKEKVRSKATWVIGSTMPPSDNLLKLLILINALKTAAAKKINVIIPYFGYARQDWIDQPNAPLTAKLMADLLAAAGADKILTFNLHSGQNEKFFTKPLVHLSAYPALAEYFKKMCLNNLLIFSPDQGGIHRAEQFAKIYGKKNLAGPVGYCKKYRPRPNVARISLPKGADVKNKNIVLVDDLIDTAGTLAGAAEALHRAGARAIYAAAAHGVLSGPAIARIKKSPIKEVLITDTYPMLKAKQIPKIKIISAAPVLKKSIV
ncbi:ribose-phosphate pyrophosphokinase [Candidatus Falkowbacteria bacterium]|nr:ribose-phosphate pyrophosphokinase [Candidatus Falkowbacteria bacterium]